MNAPPLPLTSFYRARRVRLRVLIDDMCINGKSVHDLMPREWQNLDRDNWSNYLGCHRSNEAIPEHPKRFVRVERCSGDIWLTFTDSFEDDPQFSEDYQPMCLIDLDTGTFYVAVLSWGDGETP